MHTSKSIPNFQFKIRFNSIYNSWEVYTYRLGETDPSKAKWMLCTKDTAEWYRAAKDAIVETFNPVEILTSAYISEDILVADTVEAMTRKATDSPELRNKRELLEKEIRNFMNSPIGKDSQAEMQSIVTRTKEIKRLEDTTNYTKWSEELKTFDDSGITPL